MTTTATSIHCYDSHVGWTFSRRPDFIDWWRSDPNFEQKLIAKLAEMGLGFVHDDGDYMTCANDVKRAMTELHDSK